MRENKEKTEKKIDNKTEKKTKFYNEIKTNAPFNLRLLLRPPFLKKV